MDNGRGGFKGNQGSNDRRGGGFRRDRDSNDRRSRDNGDGFRGRNDRRGGGGFRNDRGGGNFRRNQGPREMHKAVCAECGNECEVPFKPSGDRPVYCRDCFDKQKKF